MTSGPFDHARLTQDAPALQHLSLPDATQPVDEAVAVLNALRQEIGSRWHQGETPAPEEAEVVVVPNAQVGEAVLDLCRGVSTLVGTTRYTTTAEVFLDSDRQNRAYLAQTGATMISYFDVASMRTEVLQAVAAAGDMPYYLSYAPLQMKILGEREVLLAGPVVDDEHASLLLLRGSAHLEAAQRYVDSAHRVAVHAADLTAH